MKTRHDMVHRWTNGCLMPQSYGSRELYQSEFNYMRLTTTCVDERALAFESTRKQRYGDLRMCSKRGVDGNLWDCMAVHSINNNNNINCVIGRFVSHASHALVNERLKAIRKRGRPPILRQPLKTYQRICKVFRTN
jgi:hypothetical protein